MFAYQVGQLETCSIYILLACVELVLKKSVWSPFFDRAGQAGAAMKSDVVRHGAESFSV